MTNFTESLKTKSDQELLEMVSQKDWSDEMMTAVEQELAARNLLPADLQEKRKAASLAEEERLSAGKEASTLGVVLGWMFSLGLLGFFVGVHYYFSKAYHSVTGNKYYKYNESSRKMGLYMMCVSGTVVTISLLIVLFKLSDNT